MESIGKWMTKKMMSASADMMANSAFYDKKIGKDPKIMEEATKPLKENPNAMDTLWFFSKRNLPENEKTKEKILAHLVDYGKVPVLVVSGVQDKIVPLAEAVKLSRNIPGASLVQIPECGHVPIDEKPRDTVDAVLKFIYENIYVPKKSSKSRKAAKTPEESGSASSKSAESSEEKTEKKVKEKKKSKKKLTQAAVDDS
jgi:hypothetical protein